MDSIKPPEQLKLKVENVAENWERFKKQMKWYLLAINVPNDQSASNVAILLTVAGAEAQDVFNTFTYAPAVSNVPAESPDNYDIVLRKFETYCVPRNNKVYETYTFNTHVQEEGEIINSFVTALRLKAATCEFGTLLFDDQGPSGSGDQGPSPERKNAQGPRSHPRHCHNHM